PHRLSSDNHVEVVVREALHQAAAAARVGANERTQAQHPGAGERLPGLGDDVHHTQEGVGAIERGGRTANDFNSVDERQRNELLSKEVAGGGLVVDREPVNHHLDDAAARTVAAVDAAHAHVVGDQVVDVVEAGYVAQNLREVGVAPALNLV